jgi:Uma2 family endonuclease
MAINLTHAQSAEDTSRPPRIPPLESGDHLTRREFERRYEAMPRLNKAELVEGVVYMPSPLKFESHAEPHSAIIAWLAVYRSGTPGVRVGDNPTLRLDEDNEVQPDALLFIAPESGGRIRITSDDYLEGAPELIVEVAASSASNDLRDKMKAYRRNGVQEYAVWQVYDQRFDWWELRAGDYVPLKPDDAGILRSHIFAGLWLNVPALLSGDLAAVLATLQQGLATNKT